MSKFPYISHINDLVPFIQANPQFRIQEQPNGTTVVCYMLQDEDTFKGEHEEYAKECRGITFDTATGNVLSRTLHKFENVGQSDRSQPHDIPWNDIVRVMDKRDGSMITFVLDGDGVPIAKTKKTFTSNEALAATEFLHKDPMRMAWVAAMLENGYTPTFEWTSPRFPIVLTYEKDELTLLHIRHNTTGQYMSEAEMKFMMPMMAPNLFPIVENIISEFQGRSEINEGKLDWLTFEHAAKTRTGIEGWIIQSKDGEMWKIKTAWYCELHHSVTFTRWRDVARTVCDDKSDDLKAAFAMTGRSIEPILRVERDIGAVIYAARLEVAQVLHEGTIVNSSTAKDMALKYKNHEYFGQIMRTFRGQEIDWMDWYKKNHINVWSLDVIPTAVINEDTEPTPAEDAS